MNRQSRLSPTTAADRPTESPQVYFAHTSNASSVASYLPGFNENATLPFVPGKTYRLRLINMSALGEEPRRCLLLSAALT